MEALIADICRRQQSRGGLPSRLLAGSLRPSELL